MTREEALEFIGQSIKPDVDMAKVADAIKALEQEPRWIPVSERLPKEDGEYLLFGKIDEDEENYIFVGEYDSCCENFGIWQAQYDRSTLGCRGSEFYEYASVTAWMPLPKPYEPQKSEEV